MSKLYFLGVQNYNVWILYIQLQVFSFSTCTVHEFDNTHTGIHAVRNFTEVYGDCSYICISNGISLLVMHRLSVKYRLSALSA